MPSAASCIVRSLPVVISDQVNIHAEVARAGAGVVTRCAAEEVAGALDTLLRDRDRRRTMGKAGRQLVQERYTWPAIVDALTREYEAIINRHRASTESGRRTFLSGLARGDMGGNDAQSRKAERKD